MSADDTDDGERDEDPLAPEGDEDPLGPEGGDHTRNAGEHPDEESPRPRERLEESFDEGVIDLLSWLLDTDTRARIYVYLRKEPESTSKEVAEGTGLYPSTVREALAELHDEEIVTRKKRTSEGAGNNPYEYSAIPPSDLVGNVVDTIQHEFNALFDLDQEFEPEETDAETEPVTITVRDQDDLDDEDDDEADADDADEDDDQEGEN
jgi:predicted transcriptional regulator